MLSNLINNLVKKRLLQILPDREFIYVDYFICKREFLNLQNPQTLSEKIQWIKVYGHLEKYTSLVDKYEVRKYITETIGNRYLNPLIGVWDKFEVIPFNQLPKKFVLKATHGSGYVYVCKDKSNLDRTSLAKTANNWLKESFYKTTRESQYKNCQPRIIAENYLEDASGDLRDYKFLCFNGQPEIIQVDLERFSDHHRDFYDLNWNPMKLSMTYPNSGKIILKPDTLQEMIALAKKLSRPFPFVRVDLYSVDNKVYFGELTFTPANGISTFHPQDYDLRLGQLVDLEKYNFPI
jgi:hypothetical protein